MRFAYRLDVPNSIKNLLFLLLVMLSLQTSPVRAESFNAPKCDVKAFPQAAGFGTETPGGRGGKVIYVTTLSDSGPGSLREALLTRGERTILFQVSGTIQLSDDIRIREPFLTIAGQTAPGEGVQIRGGQIRIETHDVIVRYLKVRSGDEQDDSWSGDRDAITINHTDQAYNIVIDHSTLIWGPDVGGVTFLNGAHDATVSYSILGEGLYLSNHPEGTALQNGHSMGVNITELTSATPPTRITIHHNLITSSADRNPRVIGGINIDIVNNVIYNWRYSSSQGNPRSLNLVNNFYIPGPMTNRDTAWYAWMPSLEDGGRLRSQSVYEEGNQAEGFTTLRKEPMDVYVDTLFEPFSLPQVDSPTAAYRKILANAGANLQVIGRSGLFRQLRDEVDRQIMENLSQRGGSFFNGVEYDQVVGFPSVAWPDLKPGRAANDKDLDGMPDYWEQMFFHTTERGKVNSSKGDYDKDGYTDLEEYLNRTNPTRPQTCPQD